MRSKDKLTVSKGITHIHCIDVRFSEVDSLEIVWHGNYIKYMEDGREAFGRAFGISYLDIKAHGYTIPVVKVSCEFKKALRYGEKAVIKTTYIDTEAAKIVFMTHIYNENDELVASGETVQVFIDDKGDLCLQNPDFYSQWKATIFQHK